MINYQYIHDLFKAVLSQSKAIDGRFYIGWRYGLQDINYDNLGQMINEATNNKKKWPLAMMAPPHSLGDINQWEEFRILLFFMNASMQSQYDPNTMMVTHSVLQDWHDMKRCALNFLNALWSVQDAFKDNNQQTRFVVPKHKYLCVPISYIGADRIAGVRLDFDFKLYTGCMLEDYKGDEYPTILNIPDDGHPEHIF